MTVELSLSGYISWFMTVVHSGCKYIFIDLHYYSKCSDWIEIDAEHNTKPLRVLCYGRLGFILYVCSLS